MSADNEARPSVAPTRNTDYLRLSSPIRKDDLVSVITRPLARHRDGSSVHGKLIRVEIASTRATSMLQHAADRPVDGEVIAGP